MEANSNTKETPSEIAASTEIGITASTQREKAKTQQVKAKNAEEAHHQESLTNLICIFYMRGKCLKGKECNMFHPPVCRHYEAGTCTLDKCPFVHADHALAASGAK